MDYLTDRDIQLDRTLSDWVEEQTSGLAFMRQRTLEVNAKASIKKCQASSILTLITIGDMEQNVSCFE